ncbi:hypothetical protein GQ607_003665 [Colletotrichum asianum]|uniref:Uncharacterized protein n=1 Tax=Colletotrichum asianum TaxID=702518 RepID=A0A8H3WQY3_9PEZI|nr:hypothetical protein GQ607_003665 [Colletotrichum asianum]
MCTRCNGQRAGHASVGREGVSREADEARCGEIGESANVESRARCDFASGQPQSGQGAESIDDATSFRGTTEGRAVRSMGCGGDSSTGKTDVIEDFEVDEVLWKGEAGVRGRDYHQAVGGRLE